MSVSLFIALLTVFHSIRSPNNSSISHSVLLVLFLPYCSFQLYISVKVSFSPDIIFRGWLGLKHQLINCYTQMCVWRVKWMLYAPDLWPVCHWHTQDLNCMHLISLVCIGRCVMVSWVSKKHVQKLPALGEMALSMFLVVWAFFGCEVLNIGSHNMLPSTGWMCFEIHGIWCDPLKILGDPPPPTPEERR